MFDILNIIISISIALYHISQWRNEMNKQGADWIRYFRDRGHGIKKRREKQKYERVIKEFLDREVELNQVVVISKYVAVCLVILTITFVVLYCTAPYIPTWASPIVVLCSYVLAGVLIKMIAKGLHIDEFNTFDDIIFVVSSILCIALLIRNWRLGLFALGSTLGKYIWVDVIQRRKIIIKDIVSAFKTESQAVITAMHMTIDYLLLYGVYLLTLSYPYQAYAMICAYVVLIVSTDSLVTGAKIITKSTKKAVDEKIQNGGKK